MTEACTYTYPEGDRERPGETCASPVLAAGLCSRHYTQERRGRLGKSHEIAAAGEGDQITFHCSKTLKTKAERAAKKLRVSLGEYLRRLIEDDTPDGQVK